MVVRKLGTFYDWPHGSPVSGHSYYDDIEKRSVYFNSTNHRRRNVGAGDVGGFWYAVNKIKTYQPGYLNVFRPGSGIAYSGGLLASDPSFPDPLIHDFGESFGPEGFNKTRPDKPVYPVANALYELRDVPQMFKDIPKTFKRGFESRLEKYGNTYIGTSFGWVPFVQDLFGFATAHHEAIKRLVNMSKNESRTTRRRVDLLNKEDVLDEAFHEGYEYLYPGFVTQCYAGVPQSRTQLIHRKKVWFVAKYHFELPDVGPQYGESRWGPVLRKMEGLNITPLALYKAIPWTWAIDWFANIGDNLGNLQPDVLDYATQYAYVMSHEQIVHKRVVTGRFHTGKDDNSVSGVSATTEAAYDFKSRTRPPHFELRLKTDELSAFQTGIATAFAVRYLGRHY